MLPREKWNASLVDFFILLKVDWRSGSPFSRCSFSSAWFMPKALLIKSLKIFSAFFVVLFRKGEERMTKSELTLNISSKKEFLCFFSRCSKISRAHTAWNEESSKGSFRLSAWTNPDSLFHFRSIVKVSFSGRKRFISRNVSSECHKWDNPPISRT